MRSSMAFADASLEAEAQNFLFLCYKKNSSQYLRNNICLSLLAFTALAWQGMAPDLTRRLLVQAAYAFVSLTALYHLHNTPAGFSWISNAWFFVHRLCVCVRCADVRSMWFAYAGNAPFLRPTLSLHYFVSTLFFPIIVHCMGMPLPLHLDALSGVMMLVIVWATNKPYCAAIVPEDSWGMLGMGNILEGSLQQHWDRAGLPYDAASPNYLTTVCQAKLGTMQACALMIAILLGLGREIKRRREFLYQKRSEIPEATTWPIGSKRVMLDVALEALTVCTLMIMMSQLLLVYLSTA
jgi:hypothetical protein